MIINRLKEGIGLRWRNKSSIRQECIIPFVEYQPYFYINSNEAQPTQLIIGDKWGRFPVELTYELGDYFNLAGEQLTKVTWSPSNSNHTRNLKDCFIETYEADVAFHYRFCVDELEVLPEYKLNKWYWDMEWMQGGEYDGCITCISVYDSYRDVCEVLWWSPNKIEVEGHNKHFNSERGMLHYFLNMIEDDDPDMLISWFGWKFDLPKLIQRLVVNDIDARDLSPFQQLTGVSWSSKTSKVNLNDKVVNNYSPISQPIKGRICVPLDLAFERQWNDSQRGTLPSMALDYVAELTLGKKKLVSDKFPDKNDFFKKGWLEDTQRYLDYAKVDAELLYQIDNEMFITESIVALQRLLIAPFDACFYASNMGGIYFMRNATWKAPTGKKTERVEYDGAMVYDPLSENTNGLHFGVAAFDFAGLYPSMMIARNISWETKSDVPTEFGVNIKTPKDFSEVKHKDMRYYRTDKLGLLPKAVLELKELRSKYKKLMKDSKTTEDINKWNSNQLAVKRLSASFYGITAYQGFGWADVDLAASITASAREAIRSAAFKAREL